MDEKRADNIILDNKKKINEIDDKLSLEKQKLKKLDAMQDDITNLTKNIDKCIFLLSKSIKGPTTQNMFNDMSNTNQLFLKKSNNNIEEESSEIRRNIHNLYKEKDNIITENRNRIQNLNKEEVTEKKED